MHRLRILRESDWLALPEPDRLRHLSHVRNDLQGSYHSNLAPMPDTDTDKGASAATAQKGGVDGQALLRAIHSHRHDPPTAEQAAWAQFVLDTATDKTPAGLIADARHTLRWAEESAA